MYLSSLPRLVFIRDMSPTTQPLTLLFILLFLVATISNLPSSAEAMRGPTSSIKPVSAVPGLNSVLATISKRRQLSSFQICALCTCCGGPRGLCLPSPCCYSINCNIPNRPFGFCSFTPRTCHCFGCHL